ncbi:MAG: prepilin-type N-terminal cleavage/methylation domain-containing protein, partial [Candidatus Sumerlaeia bacterium]|nr:prepilin-type N-terminal cleavage/methylation domain-containing protein [Candidatus Sumerlaeia bacterium]
MNKKGFTLIELLIVVAIIAILALIAVPNFLEAQVRSKVSRVKADMRSLATGLEAYYTDWNAYPTYHYTAAFTTRWGSASSFTFGGTGIQGGTNATPWDGNPQLTTPVAYVTSIYTDPFFIGVSPDAPPDAYWYMYVNWPFAYRLENDKTNLNTIMRMYGAWRLTSGGPDKCRG